VATKTKGLNRHQRKARRKGEERISGDEIWRLVELSKSSDPVERLEAADNLCPCHVRRRIDEVWEALYRVLEDPDLKVRRAAFHTLGDGGDEHDPALDAVYARILQNETDPRIRRRVVGIVAQKQASARERSIVQEAAQYAAGDYPETGKCDFCGDDGRVKQDYDTHIPDGGGARPAYVCERCDA